MYVFIVDSDPTRKCNMVGVVVKESQTFGLSLIDYESLELRYNTLLSEKEHLVNENVLLRHKLDEVRSPLPHLYPTHIAPDSFNRIRHSHPNTMKRSKS